MDNKEARKQLSLILESYGISQSERHEFYKKYSMEDWNYYIENKDIFITNMKSFLKILIVEKLNSTNLYNLVAINNLLNEKS